MIFDMHHIGRTIARLRREHNMTQMQLADEMNVSFQAVSNWERGQSMPDISKLPELAELFSVSIDELLGRHSPLVEKAAAGKLDEVAAVTVDELAEAAPLLPPQQLESLTETLVNPGTQSAALPDMKELLPYLSTEKVDLLLRQKAAADDADLHDYAMFASTDTIDEVARDFAAKGRSLNQLLPFMSGDAVDEVARDFAAQGRSLNQLLPFMSGDAVDEVARDLAAQGRSLNQLLPFMSGDAVDATARDYAAQGRSLNQLLPFMSGDAIAEIARARIAAGKKISELLPFLSEDFLGELFCAGQQKE